MYYFHSRKYITIVYTGEDYLTQASRVSKFGYEAIELVGEPDWYNFKEVNKINADKGIKVSSICSIFMEGRDLVHSEKSQRENAINYCKQIANMAAEVGAETFIVAPSPVGKMHPLASEKEEHKSVLLRTCSIIGIPSILINGFPG